MTKIHDKLFCYIYHVLQVNFLKVAQLKPGELLFTRQTLVLRSSEVTPSLRKRKAPGSNPTVSKTFSFCNSRSIPVPDRSRQSLQTEPVPHC